MAVREIHFFTSVCDMIRYDPVGIEEVKAPGAMDYRDSSEYLGDTDYQYVPTLQMVLLNEAWHRHFRYGDRVVIHDETGCYEPQERTDRALRPWHNLFNLWAVGEFSEKI